MKTAGLLALLLMGLLGGAPLAALAEEGCEGYTEPEIVITPLWTAPVFDDTLDVQGIGVLSSMSQFKEVVKNEFPVGFMEATQKLETSFQVTTKPGPGRQLCAQVSFIEVRFGYPAITVHIAREVVDGRRELRECAYEEIKGHELQHVAEARKIVTNYSAYFKNLAAELSRNIGVYRVGSPTEAEQRAHTAIDSYMAHLNASMTTIHNKAQRSIDTPREYKRLTTVCDGALAKLLGNRLRKLEN